ncbi:hypothetical protein PtB15_2B512 [Puccinia triticina]|nr:hypothetical protein PtB15_2B512 [Puccinia triticina]
MCTSPQPTCLPRIILSLSLLSTLLLFGSIFEKDLCWLIVHCIPFLLCFSNWSLFWPLGDSTFITRFSGDNVDCLAPTRSPDEQDDQVTLRDQYKLMVQKGPGK